MSSVIAESLDPTLPGDMSSATSPSGRDLRPSKSPELLLRLGPLWPPICSFRCMLYPLLCPMPKAAAYRWCCLPAAAAAKLLAERAGVCSRLRPEPSGTMGEGELLLRVGLPGTCCCCCCAPGPTMPLPPAAPRAAIIG